MGLTVNRQIAKKSTVNGQKRIFFTVNRQMSEPNEDSEKNPSPRWLNPRPSVI